MRYAKALYVDRGGDPRDFDTMTLTEVHDWLAVHAGRHGGAIDWGEML